MITANIYKSYSKQVFNILILFLIYSAHISAQNCNVKGGSISTTNNTNICAGDGIPDIINISLHGQTGNKSEWLIVNTQNIIISRLLGQPFNFENSGPGTFKIYHVSFTGNIQNSSPGNSLSTLNGCFGLSNSITIRVDRVDGGLLFDENDNTSITLCTGEQFPSMQLFQYDVNGQNGRFLLVNEGGIIQQINTTPVFPANTQNGGNYQIYFVAYNSINGLVPGSSIQNIWGCFSLSQPYNIYIIGQEKGGGTISTNSPTTYCSTNSSSFEVEFKVNGSFGNNRRFIITDSKDSILQVFTDPIHTVEVNNIKTLHVYHISYVKGLKNLSAGFFLNQLNGCYSLSNKIILTQNFVSSGQIEITGGDKSLSICHGAPNQVIHLTRKNNQGNQSRYFIVNLENIIQMVYATNIQSIDFRNLPAGTYKILSISYTGQLNNLDVGVNLTNISGCFEVSNEVLIYKNSGVPNGGQITAVQNTVICANASGQSFLDIELTGEGLYESSWFTTDMGGIISEVIHSLPLDFSSASTGECLVYHINYHKGIENLEPGKNISELKGCFDLSNSITVHKNAVFGGKLSFPYGGTTLLYCTFGNGPHIPEIIIEGQYGDENRWIYTDNKGVMVNIRHDNNIDIRQIPFQENHIYHLSYSGAIHGLSTGQNISNLQGCFSLSNKLVINKNNLSTSPGQISTSASPFLCKGNDKIDNIAFQLSGGQGDLNSWIITDEQGTIVRVQTQNFINFETLQGSYFTVQNIYYYSNIIGLEVGKQIEHLQGCFSISNVLEFNRDFITKGELAFERTSAHEMLICHNGNPIVPVRFTLENQSGDNTLIVISNQEGAIVEIINDLSYQFRDIEGEYFEIRAVTFSDNFTAPVPGDNIFSFEGCFVFSNELVVTKETVLSGFATTLSGNFEVFVCSGNGLPEIYEFTVDPIIGPKGIWVLTDTDENILAIQNEPVFDFEGLTLPKVHLRYLVYTGEVDGLFLGNWLGWLRGCFNFSTVVIIHNTLIEGGTLNMQSYGESHTICVQDGKSDVIRFQLSGNIGVHNTFIVVNEDNFISSVFQENEKDFNGFSSGVSKVYSISYNTLEGLETGVPLSSLQGCFDLSNPVFIHKRRALGGTIITNQGTQESSFCIGDGEPDVVLLTLFDDQGSNSLWLFTDQAGQIQNILESPSFNFDNSSPGVTLIYHIAFEDGITGLNVGGHIQNINGCFGLSNPITVNKFQARGGTLSTTTQQTEVNLCLSQNSQPVVNVMLQNVRGKFSSWLITSLDGIILYKDKNPPFKALELGEGSFNIYHLRYETDVTKITVGNRINTLQGCFDLSNPVKINITEVKAASISLGDQTLESNFCVGDQPSDPFDLISEGGRGEFNSWIVTDENGMIRKIQTTPFFDFAGDDEGINLIYLLHYNGNIQNLVENNHMNELSGCYSISNPVKINKTIAGECSTTSTQDISLLNQIYLYPNPARQIIHIAIPEGLQTTNLMVDIMDIRGVVWFGNYSITQIMRNGINIEELPAGMYLLRLRSNQQQQVVKFIKVQ